MAESEQHQAELETIDRERKRKEELLFLLLLGGLIDARSVTNASVRSGHDPLPAIRRVFYGDGSRHFPGKAIAIANGLADIDLAAREEVNTQARKAARGFTIETPSFAPPGATEPAALPRIISLPTLPQKVEIARGYRPFANQTVAEMENNVSALVADVLARAKDAGVSIGNIITTMREAFAAKGYTPATAARVRNQAVTMAARAWASGSYAGFRSPGVWNAIKGFEFVVVHNTKGQPDERVCPICKPLDGLRLPRDDSRWATLWTPRHFVCRCLIRPIFGAFRQREIPDDLPPASSGFGVRPDLSPGFTAFGTA